MVLLKGYCNPSLRSGLKIEEDKSKVLNLKEQKIIRFVEGIIKELYYGIPNKYKAILNSDAMDELLEQLIKLKNQKREE